MQTKEGSIKKNTLNIIKDSATFNGADLAVVAV